MSGWNDHQKKIVQRCLADANYLIEHESLEWYYSARPYYRPTRAQVHEGRKFSGDCTGTIKLTLCDWNGLKPIDGEPSGYGNTRTFANAARGYRVGKDPKNWQPLDVLLYKHHSGPFVGGSGEHATMLIEKTRSGVWYVFSMGSDSGPKRERWNYRNDFETVRRFPIPLQ